MTETQLDAPHEKVVVNPLHLAPVPPRKGHPALAAVEDDESVTPAGSATRPVSQYADSAHGGERLSDGRKSNGGSQPPSKASSIRRSFKDVGNQVRLSTRVSKGFNTLRDMGNSDNVIQTSELKTVRRLGEGAFAVVEEAIYTPEEPLAPSNTATTANGLSKYGADAPAGPPAGRVVAVKRLKPEIVNHQGDLESFMNEVSVQRKLANKRIVEYIGVGSTDASSEEARRRTMFLVQEFMDGGTLKRVVSRQMVEVTRQVYTTGDAFRWALHVAEGLEYLHSARPVVIHRDLKLENVLLKGSDPATAEAKIADFGLVALVRPRDRGLAERLAAADTSCLQRSQSTVTRRGGGLQRLMSTRRKKEAQTVQDLWDETFRLAQKAAALAPTLPPQDLSGRTGSYMYMAPEMYRNEPYTEKVDVFSFGVIFFELLSRYQTVCAISLAGTEEEIESYAHKVSTGYRPPIPEAWPDAVRELVAQCWAQEPAQRPPMSDVRARLQALVAAGVPGAMQALVKEPLCGCVIC
ncbi:hypothetical protein HYH03_018679 [Edaphochlamys debaryana]|uniref:Protein kinase domain-containing protein n=1 Tax=Edaphochlamys debaryana TaxID=47281 RepID=A0A836BP94_9CHLO|nr:hypothetical protein HYH03_018679 [Edaphochlamys debaryana]|eukprot:KAG2482383.1 hypothetical protein HYH03_018679 [Edaphochlamys debaryana]